MDSTLSKKIEELRSGAAKILAKQKEEAAVLDTDLRPFSDAEIKDIISVIPLPPTRSPDRKSYYLRQCQIVETQLRNLKLKPGALPYIKKYTRDQFLRSWVPAGTPYGLAISDDFGASATQGALNTKRTAGAKQNAGAGIKSQREIMFLSDRSNPVVNLVFDKHQTFNDVMENWRPKLVGITLRDLVEDPQFDVKIEKTVEEPWYKDFEEVNNKFRSYTNTLRMNIKLRKDKVFLFKIDFNEAMKRLESHKTGKTTNAYAILYSPFYGEDLYIHIYPNDDSVDPKLRSNMPDYKSLYSLNRWMNTLLDTTISGKEGVKSIVAIPHNLLDGLQEKRDTETTTLSFNSKYNTFYGTTSSMIYKLLQATPNIGENIVLEGPVVKVNTPKFNPSILKYRAGAVAFESGKENGRWVINPTGDDITTSLEVIKRSLDSLRGIKYILDKNRIIVTTEPTITIIGELKVLLETIIANRVEEEERLRAIRIKDGSDISIIVPLTTIESLATLYTAEVVGGNMLQFATEIGIDASRSYSNNSKEINRLLGISAVRKFLTLEIDDIWSGSGVPLQPHSIITMADSMTYRGSLTPSSHNGITSHPIGFLSKATVSFTTKHISLAALNGEKDNIQSASAALMVGKLIKYGTGIVKLRSEQIIPSTDDTEPTNDEDEVEEVEYINTED